MKIGWIGLGKLGLPCAVALDAAGHDVVGYDVSPAPAGYLADREVPYREEGLAALLQSHGVRVAPSIDELVDHADLVFVAVQTPHHPAFDGTRPAPEETADFEYAFLTEAVRHVARAADARRKSVTGVVVSTVLPGTFDRHLRRYQSDNLHLIYNPFFIAMGTTVADFTNPEFVLVGADAEATWDVHQLEKVYEVVHRRPMRVVSIASAELTKVAYNVSLSAKIAFANYVGEIAAKTGADADEVTGSLALAVDRIVSPKYMSAGMGDGGGCHPRDLIALSHLAERAGLSYDLAGALMDAREAHSNWFADTILDWAQLTRLPVVLLGRSYKPETNLTLGSPAALLAFQLRERGMTVEQWDPYVDEHELAADDAAVFFVATRHEAFQSIEIPAASVVLDPFGYIPDRPGVTTIRIGRG